MNRGADEARRQRPQERSQRFLRTLRRRARLVWDLCRTAAVEWWQDDPFQLAAALAFYTIFSLAPLIVIALAVAGAVFGEERATQELVREVEALVGEAGGQGIRTVIANVRAAQGGAIATALGLAAVAAGSTAVFAQLQTALNRIWGVEADPRRGMIEGLVRNRVLGLALALGTGFLLMVSLLLSATIAATRGALTGWLPEVPWTWQVVEEGVNLVLIAGLYATLYKVLPDVRNTWRDVAFGGVVSAVLFVIGRTLIGIYLGRMSLGDVYGAAGSFAVLLVWVYYSGLISFYGAELTQVFARRHGSRIETTSWAVPRGDGKPAVEEPPG